MALSWGFGERGMRFAYVPECQTLLLRGPGLLPATLVLAAGAAARLGFAYDWGHHGDTRVSQGAEGGGCGGVTLVRNAGETARAQAQLAQAKRACGIADPQDEPIAFATVRGVPEGEMGRLVAFTALCMQAAEQLAGDVAPGTMPVRTLSRPCEDSPAGRDAPRFAGLLAALVAQRPDLRPWIPIERDPTVRVREPDGHAGLPLIVAPFVMETESAWAAVEHGGVVDDAVVAAAPALDAVWRALCVRV